jgi:hypothetical protein
MAIIAKAIAIGTNTTCATPRPDIISNPPHALTPISWNGYFFAPHFSFLSDRGDYVSSCIIFQQGPAGKEITPALAGKLINS